MALVFGIGALLISGSLAASTFFFARTYLYHQREQTALRSAALDAVFVADRLGTAAADVSDVLAAVAPQGGGVIVLERAGQWYSSALGVGPEVVPAALSARVEAGRPARTTVDREGLPTLIIGIPLPSDAGRFYRVVPLRELHETTRILALVLGSGAAVASVGGILLGLWASLRVVLPLNQVALAATSLAEGRFDTRLTPSGDADLDRIVVAFNTMAAALKQRIDRDARFAADVSHELRSPLTTLVAAVDVLQHRRSELSERAQLALDLITAELGRFREFLDGLLTLAKAEAGLSSDQLAPLSVGELLEHAVRRTGSEVAVAHAGPRDLVLGDRMLLERAFFNLADNAERHAGGLVGVSVEVLADRIVAYLDDAGPGIPIAERDRIFERFATHGARGSSSGTGLGLALVVEAVTAHGGSVHCTDRGPTGSRFAVELPAWKGLST